MKLNFKEIFCFLIITLGFLPYLNRFLNKFYYVWSGFWIPKPHWKSLIITLENFILGYNVFFALYLILDVLIGLFFIFAMQNFKKKDLREGLTFCLCLFLFPILLVFLFSKLFFSVYVDRALIIFSPYFYLVISLGIVSINKRWLRSSSVIASCFLLCFGVYTYHNNWIFYPYSHHTGAFQKKPFKPIARFIKNNIGENDIIGVTNINPPIIPSLYFYSQKIKKFYFFFDPKFNDPNWQRPIQETESNIPVYKINKFRFRRLWTISTDGGARTGKLDENSQSVKRWLDKNLKLKFSHEFDGLWVFIYER